MSYHELTYDQRNILLRERLLAVEIEHYKSRIEFDLFGVLGNEEGQAAQSDKMTRLEQLALYLVDQLPKVA